MKRCALGHRRVYTSYVGTEAHELHIPVLDDLVSSLTGAGQLDHGPNGDINLHIKATVDGTRGT